MKVFKFLIITLALGIIFISVEAFGAASATTQVVAGGGVTVKVTFLNPKSADDPRFQVMLDTHSVDLDRYDIKTLAVLRDDTGKSYAPAAADNSGGGHHRQVALTFPKVIPGSKRLELVIKDVAGVKDRTFVWNLE